MKDIFLLLKWFSEIALLNHNCDIQSVNICNLWLAVNWHVWQYNHHTQFLINRVYFVKFIKANINFNFLLENIPNLTINLSK